MAQGSSASVPAAKYRHEWFQSPEHVTISLYLKSAPAEQVHVAYPREGRGLTVSIAGYRGPTGEAPPTDVEFAWDPLQHAVLPAESEVSVRKGLVEVRCRKARVGVQWTSLEGEEGTAEAEEAPTMASALAEKPPAYPSSSKKKQNWDQLAKEAAELDKEEADALNSLFQTIYKDASPETRRAMIKSYTESNGTHLSTNWEDVSKGRVAITPPEGMVAKPFAQ